MITKTLFNFAVGYLESLWRSGGMGQFKKRPKSLVISLFFGWNQFCDATSRGTRHAAKIEMSAARGYQLGQPDLNYVICPHTSIPAPSADMSLSWFNRFWISRWSLARRSIAE